MTTTPELDRKLNGAENAKTSTSGEEDPCIEETKTNKLSFKERTETKLREKSGLSRKGLLIAGLILLLLLILFIIVIALGASWPHIPHYKQFPVCDSSSCLRAAAQIRESLQTNTSPCTDIWEWACGGWLKNNPLPPERSLWNQRQQLKAEEASRIRELISTLPLPIHSGTIQWKLKHLYESCMEIDNIDADDVQPLLRIINTLGGWQVIREWDFHAWDYKRVLEQLHSKYGATPYFKITVEPNPHLPSKNSIRISPAGLGLPDRSFYYRDPEDKIVVAYKRLLRDVVLKLRATSSQAIIFSKEIFHYEKRIAEITPESVQLQDPVTTYNSISVSELKITAASLPLREILVSMFPEAGITDETEILVSSVDYLTAISSIVSSTDRSALNNYLIWCLVREFLPYLSMEYTAELQQYKSELIGVRKPLERWEQCINFAQKYMGLGVHAMLENHTALNDSAVALITDMFKNIRSASLRFINEHNFPADYRRHIIQKTSNLNVQIGFPKSLTTDAFLMSYYSNLYVQKLNMFQNILNGIIFLRTEQQQRYLEPFTDSKYVTYDSREIFKVKYSGPTNTIIIPRELLVNPYFDDKYPQSIIYGRIGVDIAKAIVSSILPYQSSWTRNKGLLSSYHLIVNQSMQATTTSRQCLMNYVINNNYATEEIANLTSLSTLKHITALKLAGDALKIHLENKEHIHQPGLEIYEDEALFYMSYAQNQCSKYSSQQELLDNFVDFTLNDKLLLQISWSQLSNFAEALQCTKNTNAQCSDIV